jgi:hypothetical protein
MIPLSTVDVAKKSRQRDKNFTLTGFMKNIRSFM